MVSAIIIDDEQKGRNALRQKLRDYCPDVEVLAEAADGADAISLIEKLRPQVIFLDIEMPRMDGFEMLRQVQYKDFHIIFTTAYDQYAIKAIRYSAFDYLLKPVDIEELKTAVEKARQHSVMLTAKKIETLEHNLHSLQSLNKLAIPTLDGYLFYDITQIVHLEAHSNYTTIYFSDLTKLIASRTLKDFEDLLPTEIFFRAHHSHIVNLHYIKRYIRGDGGRIELQNGNTVTVSRRKKEEFLKAIGH